jgi:NAD(P)-dependent dehydrogenase (short-subunit alcohol dehydrogenase family)
LCVDREPKLAEAIAAEVGGVPFAADVTQRAEMEALIRTARTNLKAPLTGLVDIVGVSQRASIAETGDAMWNHQLDMILRHAYLAVQLGGAEIASAGGGTMVFVGSLSGYRNITNCMAYGTAKAALHQLIRGAAAELGRQNIRVNGVAPGLVRTPRVNDAMPPGGWERIEAAVPLRRVAVPEDIANAILFLASDLASMVSGVILPVDGALGNVAALPDF